jgi:hypothetical protein
MLAFCWRVSLPRFEVKLFLDNRANMGVLRMRSPPRHNNVPLTSAIAFLPDGKETDQDALPFPSLPELPYIGPAGSVCPVQSQAND